MQPEGCTQLEEVCRGLELHRELDGFVIGSGGDCDRVGALEVDQPDAVPVGAHFGDRGGVILVIHEL